jgi:hypothetical protein
MRELELAIQDDSAIVIVIVISLEMSAVDIRGRGKLNLVHIGSRSFVDVFHGKWTQRPS